MVGEDLKEQGLIGIYNVGRGSELPAMYLIITRQVKYAPVDARKASPSTAWLAVLNPAAC